ELDGHRSFTDGGSAAFGRPGADVTGSEHAGDGGREQVVHVRRGAGENETIVGAGHGVVEPLGARQRAEEKEHEREGKALATDQGDGLEVPVLAVERTDLASVADGDAVPLELVDQVIRHRLAKVGTAVE